MWSKGKTVNIIIDEGDGPVQKPVPIDVLLREFTIEMSYLKGCLDVAIPRDEVHQTCSSHLMDLAQSNEMLRAACATLMKDRAAQKEKIQELLKKIEHYQTDNHPDGT